MGKFDCFYDNDLVNLKKLYLAKLSGMVEFKYKNSKEIFTREHETIEIIKNNEYIIRKYFDDNKIAAIIHVKNGALSGPQIGFYKLDSCGGPSSIAYIVNYKNGLKHGASYFWSAYGGSLSTEFWENGKNKS